MALKIGIIGAGRNTKLHHIPKLAAIKGVEVVAVANRSKESAQKVADEFNIPQVLGNWKEIIDDKAIDAVVIGTWPYLHHTIVLAALRAGKHVLTEARLALDARQARELVNESLANPHLITQVVPSPLTFTYDQTVSNILKAGTLGRLIHIEVKSIGGKFAEPVGSPLHWRQDWDLSGLNIGTFGIYYECLQRWLGDVSSVQALGQTVVGLRKDEAGDLKAVHVPDHMDVLVTHPSGATVHIVISSVLGAAPGLRSAFVIYGTEGTLTLDLQEGKLKLALREEGDGTDPSLVKEVHIAEERKNSWRVEEEFVGAIRGTEKIRFTDFQKGLHYMEVTEAVTRSLQSGAVVKLPLLYR